MLTLYSYWRSSASYRVRIALALKDIDYNQVQVSLVDGGQDEPDYRALNPQGFLPALKLSDGTVLTQSIPIIEYLEEADPAPLRLLPDDATDRARARAFAAVIACDIHPIQNVSVLKYLRAEFGQDDDGVKAWCRHWIERGFEALEPMASVRTSTFVLGDAPGLPEICLIPQVYNARRFGVDMDRYPALRDIDAACVSTAAFEAAAPEHQPDAPQP